MVLRGLGMNERAIIGQKQQTGGVVIKAPYRLNITPGELLRQQ